MFRKFTAIAFFGSMLALTAYEYQTRGLSRSFSAAIRGKAAPAAVGAKRATSCSAGDLSLRLPVDGSANRDWLTPQYVDLDPARGGLLDYSGATASQAMTYDGHTGTDFEVASFRAVDQGFSILAAADGVVESLFDGSSDRNMNCSSDRWNHVTLRHANGFATVYAHLKQKSVAVKVGQRVLTGMRIGAIGSSGCSTYPHLHLEVLDCEGRAVDPMQQKMFAPLPPYSKGEPATIMETSVFHPPATGIIDLQNPGPDDPHSVASGQPFSVGMTISHLRRGDIIGMDFITPSNAAADFSYRRTSDRDFMRSHWWGDFTLDQPGPWTVRFKINDRVQSERTILVSN